MTDCPLGHAQKNSICDIITIVCPERRALLDITKPGQTILVTIENGVIL